MTDKQILETLKNKIFSPVYFFYGEEPYYIDKLTSFIEQNTIDEGYRDFNQIVVYGREVTAHDVIDIARRFPMSGTYLLVIVKEAQDINNLELLEPYLKNPLDTTILVISCKYKKLDKRKSLYKLLNKSKDVVLFESIKLYGNKIPDWIIQRVEEMGFSLPPRSATILAEYLGNNLGRINNELNKLIINLKPGEVITSNHIEQNIGINKEFNVFELTKALGSGDTFQAYRIIQFFEANPKQNSLYLVIPMLHAFFMKVFLFHQISRESKSTIASKLGINPFFVDEYRTAAKSFSQAKIKGIVADLHDLDLKSKGVGFRDSTSYGPLKDLVLRILS